jgi:hypothetical protein
MPFDVPQSRKSITQNRFEFTLDGVTHSIPLLKFAPVQAAEEFEAGRNVAGILACCENDGARDAIRSLDGDQFGALMTAWQEASGIGAGESQASEES